MVSVGLLVLRLVVAMVLVAHGCHILFGAFAGPGSGPGGLTNTAAHYASLGLSSGFVLAVVAGVLQLGGGLLVGLGYFTRPSAIAVGALEIMEISTDSARWGFFLNWMNDPTRGNGMEFAVLIAGVLACLALSGAGEWSIDGVRAHSAAARAAGRARLRDRG